MMTHNRFNINKDAVTPVRKFIGALDFDKNVTNVKLDHKSKMERVKDYLKFQNLNKIRMIFFNLTGIK